MCPGGSRSHLGKGTDTKSHQADHTITNICIQTLRLLRCCDLKYEIQKKSILMNVGYYSHKKALHPSSFTLLYSSNECQFKALRTNASCYWCCFTSTGVKNINNTDNMEKRQ